MVSENKTIKAQLLESKNIIHVYVLLETTHPYIHIPHRNRLKHHIFWYAVCVVFIDTNNHRLQARVEEYDEESTDKVATGHTRAEMAEADAAWYVLLEHLHAPIE
jgi:hypothetical protein